MEKVLYLLNAGDGVSGDSLRERLVDDVAPRLLTTGAHRVQVNVMDSGVEAAAASRLRSGTGPCPDAMVSLWVDSANGPLRSAYDEVLGEVDRDLLAYLVTESAPLPGDRVDRRRPGYTQATTRYLQNLVVRPLTPGAPPCTAIVEESFPEAAMTDPAVFFDAVGDDVRQKANGDALMASVMTFLDFDRIDVVPTSEYSVGPAPR